MSMMATEYHFKILKKPPRKWLIWGGITKEKKSTLSKYILEHIPQKPNRITFNSGSQSSIKFVKRCTLANEDVKHVTWVQFLLSREWFVANTSIANLYFFPQLLNTDTKPKLHLSSLHCNEATRACVIIAFLAHNAITS